MKGQLDIFGNELHGDEEYQKFTEKFEPKKTTDDCYTPANVYDAIAGWVCKEYGIAPEAIVRPFWPGGDYERFEYPDGCLVLDNPPFSILSKIQRFYFGRGIRFFLFAPTLTMISIRGLDTSFILAGVQITYENGAQVNTSFVTNLEPEIRLRTAPELYAAVKLENDRNEKAQHKQPPKYSYPNYVITAAAYSWNRYGIDYRLAKSDCVKIHELDQMKQMGKSIFGGGFLLSERAAAERAAAERAAAERAAATRWQLSEREMDIVRHLGGEEDGRTGLLQR